MSEQINKRLDGRVGRLILNRPEARNAISKQMWLDIPIVIAELEAGGAEILVIEGAEDCFAAGADLMELKELKNEAEVKSNWEAIAKSLDYLHASPLASIAAIDGPCLGGGCLLACACDMRYASHRSTFAVPIAKLGIALDDANLGRLVSLVGLSKAKGLIFRAQVISATEAESIGLLNSVFGDYEFGSKMAEILDEISSNSILSIRETKASFNRLFPFFSHSVDQKPVFESYMSDDFKSRIKRALSKD